MPRSRPTFTEQARRAQLVGITLDLVAEHGYRGTSLQRIADGAGISKAAVLYHFPSKDAMVGEAYRTVIDELVAHVGAAVAAAPDPGAAVEAYLDAVLAHLGANTRRARLITEALAEPDRAGTDDRPSSPRRWATLAGLIASAQRTGSMRADADPEQYAIMLNGVVDAVVAASLEDPGRSVDDARPGVRELARRALSPPG